MPFSRTPESTIESAFLKLKQSVNSTDALLFQSTTLEDVWKAAEEIERVQRQRKSLRNMKRINPLLLAIDKYSKPIEILCQGTPYLPWIWAPIKLMLELSSGYIGIFDKLLDAYAQIAEVMPQFDRLESAFNDVPRFRMVLALVYADIVEFHRRAYKFFRRRAWHLFFDSLWKSFDSRFDGILASLARHKDLLNKEVSTIDLVEARESRAKAQEDLDAREKKRSDTYLHDTVAWLNIATESQDDELDRLLAKRLDGTCDWIFRNAKMKEWIDDAHGQPVLWVKGIPGAGKTILCTYLIERIQSERQKSLITTAYYICNSYTSGKNLAAEIMRSLTLQLLRQNIELAGYVFENYANKGFPPSVAHLRTLLKNLLSTIPTIRICIDGLDEYPPGEQRSILQELLTLAKQPGAHCRILFSSRDVDNIRKALEKKPTISFRDEKDALDKDIQAYVHGAVAELRERFKTHPRLIDKIESRIIAKADGMFLWVRLVIISLESCYSVDELEESVETLPDGLDQAYKRILDHVMLELTTRDAARALKILEWLACSFRPLKVYEIQDGITFSPENTILTDETKLKPGFVDLCKPLVEEGPGGTVDFVHYSAKEYILNKASGPFLNYVHSHYDIALSCVAYLNTSACFYHPEHSADDLSIRVAKGFHGLHPYANEYWFQHLLQYAKCNENMDHPEYQLEARLEELLLGFWKRDPGGFACGKKLDDTTTADIIRNQVEPLGDSPWLERMGLDLLTFRAYLSQEKFAHLDANALEGKEIKDDPTYFSKTSQQYQSTVRFLLECSISELPQGLTPGMLNDFKSLYTDTAFLCRYLECPRHSSGFSSAAKRNEHESSHAKPLRCADSSCEFFNRGFNSKSGLLKHNRRYHPAPEEVDPPKFEPRKEEPPPPPPPPPAPAPVAPPIEVPRPEPPKPQEPVLKQVAQPRVAAKRVSRARRGVPVHNCEHCSKIYTRAEGLRRHKLSHEEPSFFCELPDCGRAFHRADLLVRHLKRQYENPYSSVHKDMLKPDSEMTSEPQSTAPAPGEMGDARIPINDDDEEKSVENSSQEDGDTGDDDQYSSENENLEFDDLGQVD